MQKLHVPVFVHCTGQYHVDFRRRTVPVAASNTGCLQEGSPISALHADRLGSVQYDTLVDRFRTDSASSTVENVFLLRKHYQTIRLNAKLATLIDKTILKLKARARISEPSLSTLK